MSTTLTPTRHYTLELVCECGNTQPTRIPQVGLAPGGDWAAALAELVALGHAAGWHIADDLTAAECPPCRAAVACLDWHTEEGRLVAAHRYRRTAGGARVCQVCGGHDRPPPTGEDRPGRIGALRLSRDDTRPPTPRGAGS
ncbi:hypothetical protein GCM10012275_54040 [Longimycelium tulufanense]|uniref:Uncharacterized protein n=1 Tax=Longimycelium tulufanense TaxID=907463 RepID=A0A8J3CD55_9PSEU|nr:hypothetical protein [Longimycelium tulufanense]GGM76429.1 hypothetical protein GCM10012275_54040 [Longimycelium tulufanense]